MKYRYKDVVLRDHEEKDTADDIRWFCHENGWMDEDSPWEDNEPESEEKVRRDMKTLSDFLSTCNSKIMRPRLEIEIDGKHLGFVTYYPLDENYKETSHRNLRHIAIGISICDKAERGKGYGTKALRAYMEYFRKNGIRELCLETWKGNRAMEKCAEKLGFKLKAVTAHRYEKDGIVYDDQLFVARF